MVLATLWTASAVAGAAVSAAGVARRVTVTLSSDVVKPKTVVAIEATVTPHEPGRTVLFEFASSGKRFRHLGFARTNAKGVATLRRAFGALGTVRIRPEVIATGTESAVSGAVVHAQVVSVLPFVLPAGVELSLGQSSGLVMELQQRLSALGYWLGSPGGYFGDATQQAVYALEKAAGIARSGVVGPQFVAALNDDVVPVPRTKSGNAIDVDLERDLVEFVRNGQLAYVLNTSTGGGYTYTEGGATNVALTPRGVFQTERVVDGTVIDTLGTLWRPRFFVGGYAIHGDSYVPPVPESHGCVRVSNEAINWIWANNLDPIGETVWVY
jgi:peptidoglycan hydrolase-like protein with peptidoglycan-binding domain